jgi:tetratricopeptide (TPR) repeat protein
MPGDREEYLHRVDGLKLTIINNPSDVDLYIDLAIAYFYLYQFDNVIEQITIALTLDPNRFVAWNLLADIYRIKGMYQAALQAYSLAIDNWDPEKDTDDIKVARETVFAMATCVDRTVPENNIIDKHNQKEV